MKAFSGKPYIFVLAGILAMGIGGAAFADKTSVSIDAPDTAKKGSVIVITVKVSHNGNNFMHYTDWVSLRVNGAEVKRWKFSSGAKPESENFTRQVEYKVEGPVSIEAEGNCNIHGSAGKAVKTVLVK